MRRILKIYLFYLVDTVDQLNTVCCPDGGCAAGSFPTDCNTDCANLWTPLWDKCQNHVR